MPSLICCANRQQQQQYKTPIQNLLFFLTCYASRHFISFSRTTTTQYQHNQHPMTMTYFFSYELDRLHTYIILCIYIHDMHSLCLYFICILCIYTRVYGEDWQLFFARYILFSMPTPAAILSLPSDVFVMSIFWSGSWSLHIYPYPYIEPHTRNVKTEIYLIQLCSHRWCWRRFLLSTLSLNTWPMTRMCEFMEICKSNEYFNLQPFFGIWNWR